MEAMDCAKRTMRAIVLFFIFTSLPYAMYCQENESSWDCIFLGQSQFSDVYRLKGVNQQATVFSATNSGLIDLTRSNSGISIAFSSSKFYASSMNRSDTIALGGEYEEKTLSLAWRDSISWLKYSVSSFLSFSGSPLPTLGFTIAPFPEVKILRMEAGWERHYNRMSSAGTYKDFGLLVDRRIGCDKKYASLALFPAPGLTIEGKLIDEEYTTTNDNSEYSFNTSSSLQQNYFEARFSPSPSMIATGFIQEKKFQTISSVYNWNDRFIQIPNGECKQSAYGLALRYLPGEWNADLGYGFEKYTVDAIGTFETFPFTSLVLSIITNRLHMKMSGDVNISKFYFSVDYPIWGMNVRFEPEYYSITPNFSIEQWQPLLMGFGTKDYREDVLSITHASVLRLGIDLIILSKKYELALRGEQYIPITITYRPVPPAPPGLPGPPPSSADGGRAISLSIKIPLSTIEN